MQPRILCLYAIEKINLYIFFQVNDIVEIIFWLILKNLI